MRTRFADVVRIGVAVVLGGIGAAAGFTHTHDWAANHGQAGWLAWATAVVIEGIAIVAGIEIHHDRAAGRPYRFPMVVLVFGVLVQMTAQVAEAEPTPAGWLVAAMPALGFLAVVKLFMRRMPAPPAPESTPDPEPASVPVMAPATRADEPPAQPVTRPALTPVTPPVTAAPARDIAPDPVPGVKLPADITARIDTAITTARDEGREPTVEDIQRVARIPADLARRVLVHHT